MCIRRYVYKYQNFPVSVAVKMSNALVLPILTQESEMWTGNSTNYKTHFKASNVIMHNLLKEEY